MPHDETDPTSREDTLDRVLAEYLRVVDRGDPIDRQQFLAQHADIAEELRAILLTADEIERMAGPLEDSPGEDSHDDATSIAAVCEDDPPADPSLETTLFDPRKTASAQTHSTPFSPSTSKVEFGEYELLEELGRGGMGVVYKARQLSMDRTVAVKMIVSGRLANESDIERFFIEAKAAGKLDHPHIVAVFQAGEIEGHHYFSMEYVQGRSLAQLASEGPIPPEQAARYLKSISDAVEYAHEMGVLHRDLKPSNVLIDENDRPHITDFGLAKHLDRESQLTASGAAVGTPSYMSPEQAEARRDEIGPVSDVYSLGAILYEMLSGRPPFHGETVVDTLLQVIQSEPKPPSAINPDCDPSLEAICLKCLRKNPRDRYRSARRLSQDLTRYLRGEPIVARPLRPDQRIWYWLREVPLLAALLGRKRSAAGPWHIRLQWIAILAPLFALAVALAWNPTVESLRLRTIDIAAGEQGGTYDLVARELSGPLNNEVSGPIQVHASAGSSASLSGLVSGKNDLAFLQENTIHSDEVRVLAPLFLEVTLVLVRKNRGIDSVESLKGRRVSTGPPGSGMRFNALRILKHYGVALSQVHETPFDLDNQELDGVILTAKPDDSRIERVLSRGDFVPLAIHQAEQIPGLREHVVKPAEVRQSIRPHFPVETAATMAVLAVRRDTPDWFVNDVLKVLYADGGIAARIPGCYSAASAAAWQELNLHPAARRYFRRVLDE